VKVLYISGPYRGKDAWAIERNIRRAEVIALEVWKLGVVALCPHTMTRFYQGALPDQMFLAGDLELMTRCDGVLAIDGWDESTGARIEVRYAKERGLPVFVSVGEVEHVWCRGEAGPNGTGLPLLS
jgi:nucleoside 2-deoxyribosyltransferase